MENSYLLASLPENDQDNFISFIQDSFPFKEMKEDITIPEISNMFKEEEILSVILRMYPISFLEFDKDLIKRDLLSFSDVELYQVVVLEKTDNYLLVATPCPWLSSRIKGGLSSHFKLPTKQIFVVCCEYTIYSNYVNLIKSNKDLENEHFQGLKNVHNSQDILDVTVDTEIDPTVAFLRPLFQYALDLEASDIHLFASTGIMKVQLRLGTLLDYDIPNLIDFQHTVRNRLVGACGLSSASSKGRLDGKFRLRCKKTGVKDPVIIDVRYAELTSVSGPDITLRLLDKTKELPGLRSMFDESPHALEEVVRFQHAPSGMLVTSGPTGSGKTTTLSTLLNEENTGKQRIYTVEDPVEYEQSGMGQIDVQTLQPPSDVDKQKFNPWLEAIKSLLRKDPDVVMIGEIRDPLVAEQTIQMSISGHSVYTTLHLESAVQVIERVESFGIEAHKFCSALRLVLAQRLVPKLCQSCAKEIPVNFTDPESGIQFFENYGLPKYWGVSMVDLCIKEASSTGCSRCHNRGYKGYFCILEAFPFRDPTVRKFISDRISNGRKFTIYDLEKISEDKDWPTLASIGLNLLRKGLVDLTTMRHLVDIDIEVDKLNKRFEGACIKNGGDIENASRTVLLQGQRTNKLNM